MVGRGAVGRHDGFAFVEVCHGGFDVVGGIRVGGLLWWVCVCVFCLVV